MSKNNITIATYSTYTENIFLLRTSMYPTHTYIRTPLTFDSSSISIPIHVEEFSSKNGKIEKTVEDEFSYLHD